MANDLTSDVFILDTANKIISAGIIWVKKLIFVPTSAGDSITFKALNWNGTAISTKTAQTCTVTGTNTITSTGNFTATDVAGGDIIVISNGTNKGLYLINARSNDNTITIHDPALTNEASVSYSWKIFRPTVQIYALAPATEKMMVDVNFAPPHRFYGLALTDITGTCYLYRHQFGG